MNHDRSGRTRNEVTGLVSGVVVQAGYVAGDIHIHRAPGATEASAALTLWEDFEQKGKPFYPTFVRLMANHGRLPAVEVGQLGRQVLELAMLGSEGETQDRGLLNGLARPLRAKADELIDAASRYVLLLLEFAEDQSLPLTDCNAAATDVLNAYFDLVIAGIDDGRAPSWFSLDDLPSTRATMSREAADRVLYGQVDRRGRKFYPTYAKATRNTGKVHVDAVTMARLLLDLAGIGRSGTAEEVMTSATPSLSNLVIAMSQDAIALSQAFIDLAAGRPVVRQDLDLTPVTTSFTRLLVACTKAGHRPRWFRPDKLRR